MISTKANAFRSRSLKASIGGVALLATSALVLSGCAATEEPGDSGGPVEDITLNIGTALPITGNLAFLGPPEVAGVQYAVSQVNELSDETGLTIELTEGDSGDTSNQAYVTEIPRLLDAGVSAIIGAASSGVSLQFIDQVVDAGVIQFSPANTSDAFTTYDDNGLYFRTAPSDVLQGDVLGNLIAEDGHRTLGMIVLNDSYGTGLARYVTEAFEGAGGEVVAAPTYNTGDSNFDSQIAEVLAEDPDAIALITFEEVATMIPSIVSQFPAENLYFVDGNLANFGDRFDEGTLEGAKGTYPGPYADEVSSFVDELGAFVEESGAEPLQDFTYAPESFDAVVLLALASLAAGTDDPAAIAEELITVSGGAGDGEKCTTFADCAEIILGGGTADYDGVSGPITFDEVGDPTDGSIGIYQYGADNTYSRYEG